MGTTKNNSENYIPLTKKIGFEIKKNIKKISENAESRKNLSNHVMYSNYLGDRKKID